MGHRKKTKHSTNRTALRATGGRRKASGGNQTFDQSDTEAPLPCGDLPLALEDTQTLHSATAKANPGKKCTHVQQYKGRQLKNKLVKVREPLKCLDCEKAGGRIVEIDPSDLWLCISCLEVQCGHTADGHIQTHVSQEGSQHALAVNLGTFSCCCFICEKLELQNDGRASLARNLCTEVRQHFEASQHKKNTAKKATRKAAMAAKDDHSTVRVERVSTSTRMAKNSIGVCGLKNLGNTCFFNSSIQALSVTRALWPILGEREPLCVTGNLSPLASSFTELLREMQKPSGIVLNPAKLHATIGRRWRQFRGLRQEDAHELIRCVLDGLRDDERQALKHAALAADQETSADPKVSTDTSSFPLRSFVDDIFGGQLVSVVMCESCKTVSGNNIGRVHTRTLLIVARRPAH
ncbi:hypothetical protein THASP1DRAFT_33789 [Thamnocephalis sphaerospora]|uniref:Uncharacterized protein n=1 Tax=Thamnocephalis sphaerospora TaxID=78915 RepID=A0A4P9XFT2_9FUNG|nr:hypothetical protein THASP1DRAFT_33789 [Thamnocephalis sphaerospora]|eukprot:RKP04444.1 hypothetical protein THASP1DRAFT_33789 [Thamnocephalis sphaerospora]